MANATVINPATGTENSAAPQTEATSMNVPMNSAISLRVIVPALQKVVEALDRPSGLSHATRGGAICARWGSAAKPIPFSAKHWAYSDMPSFWSQSSICCIAAPADLVLSDLERHNKKSTTHTN